MPKTSKLHPTMVARAAAVKAAHAELTKTVPGFSQLHPHERTRQVQAHATKRLAESKGGY